MYLHFQLFFWLTHISISERSFILIPFNSYWCILRLSSCTNFMSTDILRHSIQFIAKQTIVVLTLYWIKSYLQFLLRLLLYRQVVYLSSRWLLICLYVKVSSLSRSTYTSFDWWLVSRNTYRAVLWYSANIIIPFLFIPSCSFFRFHHAIYCAPMFCSIHVVLNRIREITD